VPVLVMMSGLRQGRSALLPSFSRRPIKADCAGTPSRLDVELQMSRATAVSHGFRVNYKDGEKSGHVISPLTPTLCSAKCPDGTG
jgi:hypothetical protein